MANEDQLEELEALQSIYGSDITNISSDPPCFMIKLSDLLINDAVSLRFTLPSAYPEVLPTIEVPMRNQVLSSDQQQKLIAFLNQKCEDELIGMGMIFSIVDNAQQWINENVSQESQEEPECISCEKIFPTIPVKFTEPRTSGGRWQYVIGLVGKPSAGKSTFFNAATTHDLAKTGAHPFTTIEPNIGKAFFSIPCPCKDLSSLCNAVHGHDHAGNRLLPVLLKDVAGLVPGAWEGKGRGNKFLNDLLDADVLIHIIDASGTTNEKGEETVDYDPANDIHWLKEELHQWIFQNVWSKWDNIVKRPHRLIDMFTGYHANKATIFAALQNSGINESELSKIQTWKDNVLHDIVDNFLAIRFPILLVLNKADIASSNDIIQRLLLEFEDTNMIAVSAEKECYLQKLNKDGTIRYSYGGCDIEIIQSLPDDDITLKKINFIKSNILERYGSTNVHNALSKAVRLREPVFAFPVHCLDSFQSIGKSHTERQPVLKDCIMLKPGTTVHDLHTVMCHYPVNLLSGDFVRAETVATDGIKRPMKKDEIVDKSNNIVKIMTTKRTT